MNITVDADNSRPTKTAWDEFQTSVLVKALTAEVRDTEQSIVDYPEISDKDFKIKKAEAMLSRLTEQIRRLRSADRSYNDHELFLLQALGDGDYSELANLGIDVDYAWLDDVISAVISESPMVEIEAGPYTFSQPLTQDLQLADLSSPAEQTKILLTVVLKEALQDCRARFVMLIDDISDYLVNRNLTHWERDEHLVRVAKIFYGAGILRSHETPGRDYLLIRKSEYANRVDEIIRELQTKPSRGIIEITDDEEVIFRPTVPFVRLLALGSVQTEQDFLRQGILLKRGNEPTSHAIEAATFVKPLNKHIMHVLLRDNREKARQEKVYALLRALEIVRQESYNNIYYNGENLSPEIVVLAICELLAKELRGFLHRIRLYNEWEHFDPKEYLERNYGDFISADKEIIEIVTKHLTSQECLTGGIKNAIDVGTGPNLYPAMLITPYLHKSGTITLLDYSKRNCEFLNENIRQAAASPQTSPWPKFEEFMVEHGGDHYVGALKKIINMTKVVEGSIFALPANTYDLVTSFFVTESITRSREEFRKATRALVSCLRDNGILIVGHVVRSLGYYAGEDTRFPAVWLGLEELEEAYRDADLEFSLKIVGEDSEDTFRDRYHGLAIVIARKKHG